MTTSGSNGRTVAITGAAGFIAGRLIRHLCMDDSVERVLGFDVKAPSFDHEKFVFDEVDVRNPALEARLSGVGTVVHLAFVMDPIRDETEMRDINVNGSQNVFRCAGAAGVGKIIYTSSATAYGAHPDNDVPLTETSPLRANLDFSYPAHKLEVEYVVKEFRDEYPDVKMTVFRPAIVFGPHVDSAWSHLIELPVLLGVRGYRPPFQFVHEDDVARALAFALDNDLDGPYNLAPEGWLSWDETQQIIGRRNVELAEPAAFALAERLWSMGLAEAPAGMLHYVMHPWVVSVDKLKDAGFVCERSSGEVLREVADRNRDYVRLGTSRFKKGDLARGAAAGAGLLGAAIGLVALRRHRSPARA